MYNVHVYANSEAHNLTSRWLQYPGQVHPGQVQPLNLKKLRAQRLRHQCEYVPANYNLSSLERDRRNRDSKQESDTYTVIHLPYSCFWTTCLLDTCTLTHLVADVSHEHLARVS